MLRNFPIPKVNDENKNQIQKIINIVSKILKENPLLNSFNISIWSLAKENLNKYIALDPKYNKGKINKAKLFIIDIRPYTTGSISFSIKIVVTKSIIFLIKNSEVNQL